MSKMKTNSGSKKRFKLTGTGKIKRKHAYKSHILTKKTKKQKRNLTHIGLVDKGSAMDTASSKQLNLCQDRLIQLPQGHAARRFSKGHAVISFPEEMSGQ